MLIKAVQTGSSLESGRGKRKSASSVMQYHAEAGFVEESPVGGIVHGGHNVGGGQSGGIFDHMNRNNGNGGDLGRGGVGAILRI